MILICSEFISEDIMSKMITRVMLAEDEEVAREILQFYLNTIFEEVVVVKDGLEGLQTYEAYQKINKNFDLILTDIKMPNLDGIEMLEQMYKLNKNQKFIIVSAYKDEEKLLKSIELKVLGYFTKPLNVDNIMHMLQKAKKEVLKDKRAYEEKIKLNKTFTYTPQKQILYENNSIVKLSKKETLLLDKLIQSRGETIDTQTLKFAIWQDKEKSDSTFRALMKRLKDKISTQDFIISRKSLGYMIE
jgi:DNA-binding response OmpR family regulator